MSDFDRFFAEKLDEESPFPRREKNWRALSKRLDAFNAGLQEQHGTAVKTQLRYWQAAAAIAVVAAGLLTWKMLRVQSENAELRREMAVLQEQNANVMPLVADLPTQKQGQAETPVSALEADEKHKSAPVSQIFKPVEKNIEGKENTEFEKTKNRATPTEPLSKEQMSISNAVAHEEKTLLEKLPETNTIAAVQTADSAKIKTPSLVLDSANFQKPTLVEVPPATQNAPPAALDSLQKIVAVPSTDTSQNARPPVPDTLAEPVANQKPIEPLREKPRFRAGVQVVAGRAQPSPKDISLLTGQGLTAEYNFFNRFWLTASADWLRFDVATDKFYKPFHPGQKPPAMHTGPGPPHEKLVKVESNQRRQHFALGLRYQLPVHFWLRPSVSVAHTWVRVSPALVSFKFDEHGPHPPKYIVRKSGVQSLNNVWRFSAGLERETPRWVFGLWADFSQNLGAADVTFDALLLRAGVQYRFN